MIHDDGWADGIFSTLVWFGVDGKVIKAVNLEMDKLFLFWKMLWTLVSVSGMN